MTQTKPKNNTGLKQFNIGAPPANITYARKDKLAATKVLNTLVAKLAAGGHNDSF